MSANCSRILRLSRTQAPALVCIELPQTDSMAMSVAWDCGRSEGSPNEMLIHMNFMVQALQVGETKNQFRAMSWPQLGGDLMMMNAMRARFACRCRCPVAWWMQASERDKPCEGLNAKLWPLIACLIN